MVAEGFDLATVDKLLSTTRSVRRRLDLTRRVPLDVIRDCLRLALQAPTANGRENWRWVVVTDPEVRRQIAEFYRNPNSGGGRQMPEPPAAVTEQQVRVRRSAEHLYQWLHEVPVMVVPCIQGSGGVAGSAPSIYPAVWSFMLALRSRGLGSVLTTVHLYRREEADELLGVPAGFVQTCMIPVAYYTGADFRPAGRRPVEEVTFLDHWDVPFGGEAPAG